MTTSAAAAQRRSLPSDHLSDLGLGHRRPPDATRRGAAFEPRTSRTADGTRSVELGHLEPATDARRIVLDGFTKHEPSHGLAVIATRLLLPVLRSTEAAAPNRSSPAATEQKQRVGPRDAVARARIGRIRSSAETPAGSGYRDREIADAIAGSLWGESTNAVVRPGGLGCARRDGRFLAQESGLDFVSAQRSRRSGRSTTTKEHHAVRQGRNRK
jgi:hypothetical protein